jgi:hypothetical protein
MKSHLPIAALLLAGAIQAQNAIDEPNPFKVVGEKPGDPQADVLRERMKNPREEGVPATAAEVEAIAAEADKAPLNAQISQHIIKLAEEERDKRMSFMRIVIDDIVRLCELDAAQQEKLELAALGASERSMKEWHEQAERYFRNRLESADPDAAKEMLEGMGGVNFSGNRSEEEGESLDLWKDSLKNVLSDEQVGEYEAVLEARKLARIDAFARMSVSTIDDHLRLTPVQRGKISEIVQAAASEYLEDMQRYWGDYFERGMLMSLANAAEDDVLRGILTEQQLDRHREATSNFDHFWEQKRVDKRNRKKAAEMRKAKQEDVPVENRKPGAVRVEGSGIRVKLQ